MKAQSRAQGKKVVLGVTASVAIYKACDVVRRCGDKEWDVCVVMTDEAARFISPLLFQSLSGNSVYHGLFGEPDAWEIEHVALADRAGVVVIAPATANIIAKIACGICDDLLTCVVAATRAPVVICPAMNDNMYTNKITQENIARLKSRGYVFVEPRRGKLACGRVGPGCLAEPDVIVDAIDGALKSAT